jgi:GNAT superfamily N-acetyltransferase
MSRHPKTEKRNTSGPVVIRDEYTRVPPGKVAAIVTHLEMKSRPPLSAAKPSADFTLRRVKRPELGWYRELYRRVGENWLWFSRLTLSDDDLAGIVHHPAVEVHALAAGGRDQGILEMDFRRLPDVEISFLGVTTPLIGKGAGRFLIDQALQIAWARNPKRVTIHTCTLDHPHALEFYRKAGFVPYARSTEIADDPRLTGLLGRNAAPHVPIVEVS